MAKIQCSTYKMDINIQPEFVTIIDTAGDIITKKTGNVDIKIKASTRVRTEPEKYTTKDVINLFIEQLQNSNIVKEN